jgi:hypothetical protein
MEIGDKTLYAQPLLPRQIGKRENSRYAAQNTSLIQVSAFAGAGLSRASRRISGDDVDGRAPRPA